MIEYTTSSQAIREYMTARERTAYWVQHHSPNENEFYSPSVPPSVLGGYVPPSPQSDAESSHSLPPKMVLRYSDGRPDIPIPHSTPIRRMTHAGSRGHHSDNPPRSQTLSYNANQRARTGSHGSSPLSRSYSRRQDSRREQSPLRAPEEIRVLPSHGDVHTTASSHQPRSKSLPRMMSELQAVDESEVVPFPPPLPTPQHPNRTRNGSHVPTLGQQVTFAPPHHPTWHPHADRPVNPKHYPPSIIYAPSHHSRTQYTPPAILHHPPQTGPNGVVYSHSAPIRPMQYAPTSATQYSSGIPQSHSTGYDRNPRGRDRFRSLSMSRPGASGLRRSSSSSSLGSDNTGSTYYVLPSAGQKVHIIAPSPEQSIMTATSTTKSPTSPRGPKKPFFQRLFGFAGKFSSPGSTKGSVAGGRKLQRRHSTGASARPRVVEQGS